MSNTTALEIDPDWWDSEPTTIAEPLVEKIDLAAPDEPEHVRAMRPSFAIALAILAAGLVLGFTAVTVVMH